MAPRRIPYKQSPSRKAARDVFALMIYHSPEEFGMRKDYSRMESCKDRRGK